MRSSRNDIAHGDMGPDSLIDWKMRSSRNCGLAVLAVFRSLIDWKMRSSRNPNSAWSSLTPSLIDWKMRSSRNPDAIAASAMRV